MRMRIQLFGGMGRTAASVKEKAAAGKGRGKEKDGKEKGGKI